MFDNLSKFLAQQYPQDFASWLVVDRLKLADLNPIEFSIESTELDRFSQNVSMILLESSQTIVQVEFRPEPEPEIGCFMANDSRQIMREYPDRTLIQVVIYLRPATLLEVDPILLQVLDVSHEIQQIRLWEEPTETFLRYLGLLPYAVLANRADQENVLREVAQRLDRLDDRRRRANLSAITALMSGLLLDKTIIYQLLDEELMKESEVYQMLRQEILTVNASVV